jgi:hypothetical protein
MILTGVEPLDESAWLAFADLERAVKEGRLAEALRLFRVLVPEYVPMSAGSSPAANIVEIAAKKRLDANV